MLGGVSLSALNSSAFAFFFSSSSSAAFDVSRKPASAEASRNYCNFSNKRAEPSTMLPRLLSNHDTSEFSRNSEVLLEQQEGVARSYQEAWLDALRAWLDAV